MAQNKGSLFEERIFKKSSHPDLGKEDYRSFKKSLKEIKDANGVCPYPDTNIGKSLHQQTEKELNRLGIDSTGLIILTAVGTKLDFFHSTDGAVCLPSLRPHVAKIDTFYINTQQLLLLKSRWVDSHAGEDYSNLDFQADLFSYKKGFWEYLKKTGNIFFENEMLIDFRLSDCPRPENHFILTPYQADTYRGRREFAKLVAGYFAKVSGLPRARNCA